MQNDTGYADIAATACALEVAPAGDFATLRAGPATHFAEQSFTLTTVAHGAAHATFSTLHRLSFAPGSGFAAGRAALDWVGALIIQCDPVRGKRRVGTASPRDFEM
jgi:hypothetical protein